MIYDDREPCNALDAIFAEERFTCSGDAINTLFEELMLAVNPSKMEIYQALHFLAARNNMTKVAFEIEDLGPEAVL